MQKEIKLSYLILITGAVLLGIILLFVFVIQREPTLTEQLTQTIRQKLNESNLKSFVIVGTDTTHADALSLRFYSQRDFQPAWINNKGPMRIADSLVKVIHDANLEGLNPQDYHSHALDSMLSKIRMDLKIKMPVDIEQMMDLEVLLTDAFLLYGNHLLSGRVNPESIDPEWVTDRPEADMIEILNQALILGQVQETLLSLLPKLPCYAKLREEMVKYKAIAMEGGWPIVPPGPTMKKGDQGFRVAALSARLISSGDMNERPLTTKTVFDDTLEMAVRNFQDNNGLDVDGEVGPGTLAFLNKPSLDYVRKIEVNMERWRWLPLNLGDRYIMVNIAAYSLEVVENGETILTMPVVVGKDYRQTPVFSGTMTYLVLNPYWHVPPTITAEDILPELKKNTNYVNKKNIEIVRKWNDPNPIDPHTVDWALYTKDNLPFKFRQPPGPTNALGRIKFMFPNKYDVYLHDTPQRSLFERTKRAFSSGCIRVAEPLDLAEYVLKGNPKWIRQAIIAALDSVKDFTIRLPKPIAVHIFYCTAWVDKEGGVHFREDLYNRDVLVENALRKERVLQE